MYAVFFDGYDEKRHDDIIHVLTEHCFELLHGNLFICKASKNQITETMWVIDRLKNMSVKFDKFFVFRLEDVSNLKDILNEKS